MAQTIEAGHTIAPNPVPGRHRFKLTPKLIFRLTQLWILALIVGSLQPFRPVAGLHREIHWLAFAGVALLLLLGSGNRRQEIRGLVATFLLGLSLEGLQHFLYRHAMEWGDVRDDTLAIIAALALYRAAIAVSPGRFSSRNSAL